MMSKFNFHQREIHMLIISGYDVTTRQPYSFTKPFLSFHLPILKPHIPSLCVCRYSFMKRFSEKKAIFMLMTSHGYDFYFSVLFASA